MELNLNNQKKAKSELFKRLDKTFLIHENQNQYKALVENYRNRNIFKESVIAESNVTFEEDFDLNLLQLFISSEKQRSKYYHYTSFASLASILISGKIRLSCIVGMNDSSEIYFADNILGFRKPESKVNQNRINYANDRFLLSFSTRLDDLNQWRLYGDDGKGVCLEFHHHDLTDEYKYPKGPFIFGNVLYNPGLADVLKKSFSKIGKSFGRDFILDHIYLWRNFFKAADYAPEEEYRVIFFNSKNRYSNEKINWDMNKLGIFNSYVELNVFTAHPNIFPMKITKIILGPKVAEQNINIMQLEYFKRKKKYAFDIEISKIKSYR